MPNTLNSSGLTTATQQELLARLTAALKLIYGNDINLSSDTPDGQWINVIVQAVLDNEGLLTQVYNSFDPDNAIGVVLDQRCAINGIQRQAATYTTTNITIVNSQAVSLYGLDQSTQPVYTAQDDAGNQWQLIATELSLSAGTNVLLFQSATPGQVLTVPNTITTPVTIVLGVDSLNNPTAYATLGVNEESDALLKIRRQKSVGIQSEGYFQSLVAALENINGITSAFVYENTGASVDADLIPGHSIWVVVSGTESVPLSTAYNSESIYQYGNIASSGGVNYISVADDNQGNSVLDTDWWKIYNPIAEAIYNYRNAGCGMKYNVSDSGAQAYTITQIDGSFFSVYWYTVIPEDLYIEFVAKSLNGGSSSPTPPNISGIKDYLVSNFIPGVAAEVNFNELSTFVQLEDPNTLVVNAGFSTSAGGTYSSVLSPTAKNNQFVLTEDNIIILPMIMSCPGGTQTFTLSGGLYQVDNTTVSCVNGSSIQFTALGGFPAYTYAMTSGTGSINASTGVYTSAGVGTDVVHVTDSLSNTQIATITVTA